MVHKKYTYKKGKRFGPYYYETKRVNGEVVTTYLGNHAPKSNLFSKYKFIFLSVLIISLIAFALFYSFGFTGLASLDIKTEYDSGELISGKINLNLVEGELIPADSKIIVNYAGVSKEFVLSSLVSDSVSNGSFYAEGVSLSGEGSGYGISGTKVEYPFVDFEFIIESDSGQQGSSNEGQGNSGSGGSSGEQGNSGSSGGAVNESENPGSSGNSGNENSQGEGQSSSGSSSEEQGNSGSEGSSGSSNGNSGNENGNAGNSNSENGNNGNSGNENTGNENGGNGNSGITGSVVSDSDTISGRASRDEPFIYSLSDGEDAVLVSGSVAYDDDVLDDDVVKFKVGNNELEVSTDYSVETTGFGVDYIGTKKIKISIDLSSFGFVALNDSELSVVLDYNGVEIVSASENIVVSGVSEGNETAEPVEPIVNDTVVGNLTEVNQTLVENVTNITSIINESSIFINLSQFGAVLGQPVKWVKSVAFDVNDSVSLVVEIPLSAENITLDKINLTEYAEIVDLSEEEVDSLRSSMNNRYSELSNGSVSETGLEVNVSSNDSVSEESNSSMLNESVLVRETVSLFNESTSQNLTIGISGGVISGRAISGRVTANVDLKKESFFSRLFKAFFSSITGRVVEEINETEVLNETSKKVKEVSINLSEDDFGVEVEYYTGAPVAVENVLSDRFKTVFVSSPDDVHYENVLMFTNISNLLKVKRYNEIIVEWVENNTQIPVLFVNDTNLDGNYDSVYWVAPRLSNQTFNIIVITSAQHLNENYSFISDIYNETSELDNIWSEPIPSGHYVRVTFEKNLTSENDITIYPRNIQNLSTLVEVYYINSTVKISEFPVINETGYYKIYLTNLTGTSDIFDLRVFNLDNISDAYLEFDYIVDPTAEPNGAKILMAQTCDAMADSESENNYVSVCGGTYPSDCSGDGGTDSISCSDGSLEDTSNTGSTYAGVKITTFNDTITNCASITAVSLCYEWWTDIAFGTTTCPIYVSADGGASESDIGAICPGTGGSPTSDCVDVTSLESWNCGNFFGASGTRALARTEVLNDMNKGDQIVSHELLSFSVTYTETVPQINFTSLTPANNTIQNANSILVNVSASHTDNISSFIDFDNSLTGWWRMDDLNSSNGVVDYTGRSNGTVVGNAVQNTTSGKMGKSFTFDGNNDYINIPIVQTEVIPFSNMTVSAWVYLRSNKDWNIVVSYNSWVVGKCGFQLQGYATSGFAFVPGCNQGNPNLWAATTGYSLNNWNHFVGTYDGVTARLYLNGTQVASATNTTYNINFTRDLSSLWISTSGGTASFNGSIDDFMLFNRTLTAVEVRALYANTTTKYYSNNFTSLSDGGHRFKAYAQDLSGNVNSTELRTVSIDTVFPIINFTNPTPVSATTQFGNSIFVNVSASDSVNNISSFIDFDNSLVSWWRMDDANTTAVFDYTGMNNASLLNGGGPNKGNSSSTLNGKLGKGWNFKTTGGTGNGNGDYFSTSGASNCLFANLSCGTKTISLWVYPYPTSYHMGIAGTMYWVSSPYSGGWSLNVQTDNKIYFNWRNNSAPQSISTSTIAYNQWYHVVAIGNETYRALYLNGTLVNSITSSVNFFNSTKNGQTDNLWIGAFGGYSDFLYGLNGSIDDVMVFNRSLTANEISMLYTNTSLKYYSNNFTSLAGGSHKFKAYSQDVAGNVNYTELRTVTVQTVGAPSNKSFIITNQSGDTVAMFDDKGDAYFAGTVSSGLGEGFGVTPKSFIINNIDGLVVAYVSSTGSLFLGGTISIASDLTGLTSGNLEFRNSTNNLVSFFDNTGNLKLKGGYAENYAFSAVQVE